MTIKNHDDDDDDTGVKKKIQYEDFKKKKREREKTSENEKDAQRTNNHDVRKHSRSLESFFFNFSHLVLIYFTAFLCVKNVFSAYSNSLIVSGKNFFLLHHPLSSSISLFNCRCYCIHVIFF